MKKILAPVAVAALLLTGCGSSAEPPTPADPTASAEQFASIIAEHASVWREYGDKMSDCQSYSIGMATPTSLQRLFCGANASKVSSHAYTANGDIQALPKAAPEVSSLVGRTVAALSQVASTAADQRCSDAATDACATAIERVNDAVDQLLPILDAWKPYTG